MALIPINYHEFSSIVAHRFDVDWLMSRFSDLDRKFIVSDFYGCCFFSLHCANVNFLPDRAELTAVGLSG